MTSKTLDQLYESTARELGISEELVKQVVRHKYSCFRQVMKELSHAEILDNYLGRFSIMANRLEQWTEKNPSLVHELEVTRKHQKKGKKYGTYKKTDET